MIVVDASALYEVLIGGRLAPRIQEAFADHDQVAPHLIDAEVLGVLRRNLVRNAYDQTIASLALEDLRDWPGERVSHRGLLQRAWELRNSVRPADGLYVALAEVCEAPLLTLDSRLASASGPLCDFITP